MSDLTYQNFFTGSEACEVVMREVPASTSLVPGEIVDKGATAGAIAKCGGTVTSAYGIALETVTTGAAETSFVPVLVNGQFNKDKVVYPAAKGFADYEVPLRNIGIYLVDIVDNTISH
jgi:hypothetical protein